MHMLTEAPKDASGTIRGTASVRGDTETETPRKPATPAAPAAKQAPPSSATPASAVGSGSAGDSADADAVRSSVVDTLKARSPGAVTPRTSTVTRGYGYSGSTSGNASGKTEARGTTGF